MDFRHTFTEFRWSRCLDGYGVEDGSPEYVEEEFPVIRSASEVHEEYQPHTESPDLHFRFAEIPPDTDGCLAFITEFGCLSGIFHEQYQLSSVQEILELRDRIRSVMYKSEGEWGQKSDRFNRLLAEAKESG